MNSLKKKFGKFAVSNKEAKNVRGGFIAIDPWDIWGGGSGEPTCRWACTYHNSQHPTPRTQICPDEGSARALAESMRSLGFSAAVYPLC